MKNIHVIPTDKPSRLYKSIDNELSFTDIEFEQTNNFNTNQHIYITSDEEIKEGDFFLHPFNTIHKAGGNLIDKDFKKIILTTDQDLIKDGVQAIDDEFLEWFVKNPSCENVEVNKMRYGYLSGYADAGYKIIIPKKNFYCGDKFDYDEQCEFQCDTCVDKKGVDYGYLPKEEPKKVLTEEDIFNQKDIDAVTDYINKEQQKQALIDMMKSDEELGLYDDTEIDRIELVCKDCSDSLEDCTCIKSTIDFPRQEIKLEEIFNDDKKENIKKFIDEIKNPSEPNQALKDAAQRYEKYSERFDNKDNEIVEGIFNPETWGRRLVKEKPKQETLDEAKLRQLFKNRSNCYIENIKEWQQEKMYSEEEVIAFGEFIFKHTLLAHSKGVKNLFEQFKKK